MANLSKTYKAGEKVTISGHYECLTCKYGGTQTETDLNKGALFPMCKVDVDSTWQLVRAAAAARS
jgi:hypothetical protein